MLHHLGYERRTAGELVERLRLAGVTELVDVRLTPISRKPGLSKTRLAAALDEAGIAYRHERRLGNPADNREPFRRGDITTGVAVYTARLHDDAAAAVERLLADATRRTVAVLCIERDERRCHRQVLTRLARARGIPVAAL